MNRSTIALGVAGMLATTAAALTPAFAPAFAPAAAASPAAASVLSTGASAGVGCTFTLGPIVGLGAAGTLSYSLTLRPASWFERCTTAVTFTASIAPDDPSLAYTDIDHDPLTTTETVTFVAGERPPYVSVGWSAFHCADPAVAGRLTFRLAEGTASADVEPTSCGPPGSPHSFLEPMRFQPFNETGIARTPDDGGYLTVDQYGYDVAEGDATPLGVVGPTNAAVVGIATTPAGHGGWTVAADGGVFSYGDARFHGSLGDRRLSAPVVGIAATPDGGGYWLVASDGGVFAFGDARFHGSLGGGRAASAVVAIAGTPDGGGYWLASADGSIAAFGDARDDGSLAGRRLDAPVVAMAPDPRGGYWLVSADGGVFAFGGAPYRGSMTGKLLNAPIDAIAATSTGQGYWLMGADDGIFNFGDAHFHGSQPLVG
jgi:hypothetical protein